MKLKNRFNVIIIQENVPNISTIDNFQKKYLNHFYGINICIFSLYTLYAFNLKKNTF